jgi:hypothetical protein
MERLYQMLEAFGYPAEGIDWLRRHRLVVVLGLAAAAWALVIGLVWLVASWLLA